MTHMQGKEQSPWCCQGLGFTSWPHQRNTVPTLSMSSSLREGRQSAYCTGSHSDNGNRTGVLGAWHMVHT